jgi:hypothetical protein
MIMDFETFVFNYLQQRQQKNISIVVKRHLLVLKQCFRLRIFVFYRYIDGLLCERWNDWSFVDIWLISFLRVARSKTRDRVERVVELAKTIVELMLKE